MSLSAFTAWERSGHGSSAMLEWHTLKLTPQHHPHLWLVKIKSRLDDVPRAMAVFGSVNAQSRLLDGDIRMRAEDSLEACGISARMWPLTVTWNALSLARIASLRVWLDSHEWCDPRWSRVDQCLRVTHQGEAVRFDFPEELAQDVSLAVQMAQIAKEKREASRPA